MLNVALYGQNGHQIQNKFRATGGGGTSGGGGGRARVVAVAGLNDEALRPLAHDPPRRYETLEEIIADQQVQMVSLCSPRRDEQVAHAIACLKAGKHVYAEKPAALNEADLDLILATAQQHGVTFHEMAETSFVEPYAAMKAIVAAGTIGQVVQITARKCYPWNDHRPVDEGIDGGLLCQVGVHAARMIEQVGGQRIETVTAADETRLANQGSKSDCRRAAFFAMTLANGGLATATVSYLNPAGTGIWGYEALQVLGSEGLVESERGGQITRLVVGDSDHGPIKVDVSPRDYLDLLLDELVDGKPMPLTLEAQLHPTRVVLRAKALAGGFGA